MNNCPLCQNQNACTANRDCWCMSVSVPQALVAQIPEDEQGKSCLCENCIRKFNEALKGTPYQDATASK